jgi:hypothetical protein
MFDYTGWIKMFFPGDRTSPVLVKNDVPEVTIHFE